MAVKSIEKQSSVDMAYIGLSGDTKPTGVPVGSKYYAYDTGIWYITYDGTNWADMSNDSSIVAIDQTTDGTTNKVQARNATHDNFNANVNLQVSDTDVSSSNPVPQTLSTVTKSAIATSHNNVSATTLSSAIDVTGYTAILLIVTAITGTWKLDVQGSDGTTYVDAYDGSSQLSTGNITATRTVLFRGLTNSIKINATNVVAGAITVKYQLLN